MTNSVLTMLVSQAPSIPDGAHVMTARIELPPGDEPERVIKTSEAFWEPGGDVIHRQAANNSLMRGAGSSW
ncbi:hypothetical protein ACGFMK_28000 [Amycolatopsis sp. NPDC049252]|uniref:hypothetical protein n=1 Tax=Amycolatopsis sp. NPDC049252 TaxID=3363933 RepID=UPI00371A3B44